MKCSSDISSGHNLVIILTLTLFAILLVFSSSIIIIPNAEAKYVFSKKWGTFGTDAGKFNAPQGLAESASGVLYVADTGNNRIQVFKLANPCPGSTTQIVPGVCFVRAWGTVGTGNGQFNIPSDVALDSSGRVYVTDSGNHRIQMFRGNGAFISTWSTDGPGTRQFNNLGSVAVDTSTNEIFALDNMRQEYPGDNEFEAVIHKFRLANPCPSGTIQVVSGVCSSGSWTIFDGSTGMGPIDSLLGIGVNSVSHDVYISYYRDVLHPGHNMLDESWITKRGNNGAEIGKWGGLISAPNAMFEFPTGISVGPSGLVYVADFGNNMIQAFQIQKFGVTIPCPIGTTHIIFGVCLIAKWGSYGTGNGQFSGPGDVAISGPSGLVYVSDLSNNRIQEFFWKPNVGVPGGGGNLPGIAIQ